MKGNGSNIQIAADGANDWPAGSSGSNKFTTEHRYKTAELVDSSKTGALKLLTALGTVVDVGDLDDTYKHLLQFGPRKNVSPEDPRV
jgi:hypothetical protein